MQSHNLRPYQIEGVERIVEFLNARHAAILADEPGLGKTAQTIEVINRMRYREVLVVCPASLRLNWRAELRRWLAPDFNVNIYIRSYEEVVAAQSAKLTCDLVVFDEAHYLKNPSAKRTKACLALPAHNRLFLTGTPVVNRPMDLYPVLASCGLKISRRDYGVRYCAGHLALVRRHPKKYVWDFSGASRTEELAAALRAKLMIRRTKAEVLTELPPKIRQVIELDIADGESSALKAAVGRMFAGLEAAADNIADLKRVAFEELSAARLDIARNKFASVINCVEDVLDEEDKVVVFAYHREIVEALADAFPKAVKLYGGMTDAQKDAAVQAFQAGDAQAFVGQITAAGVGLTLTAAHTVVFAELDWVPGNITQAEDRCHRLGQDLPVRVIHLVAKDSVDARMVRALVHKQEVIDGVMA